jgi:hypothetical protein
MYSNIFTSIVGEVNKNKDLTSKTLLQPNTKETKKAFLSCSDGNVFQAHLKTNKLIIIYGSQIIPVNLIVDCPYIRMFPPPHSFSLSLDRIHIVGVFSPPKELAHSSKFLR